MDPLQTALRRLRLRMFIVQWTRALVWSLIISMGLACVWLTIARLFPSVGNVETVTVGLVGFGLLAATIRAIWKRPNTLGAALEADRRLGLQERITSSLQLTDADGPMVGAVHDDARKQLARLNYTREFPFTTPRSIRWLAMPVVLYLVAYVLLPEFDLLSQRKREAEAKAKEVAVRVEADRLVEAVKLLRELGLEESTKVEGIAMEVERIAEQMKLGKLSEKTAFAKLTNLTDQLAEQRQKLQAKSPLPQLSNEIAKLDKTKELAENIQKGDFAKALEKAQELAAKIESGDMKPEEKEALSKELEQLSKALSEMNPELAEALSKMAAGMKMNDAAQMQMAMDAMKMSLEDLKSMLAQMQKMAQAEGKLGECKNKLYCATCVGMCKTGNCAGAGVGAGLRGKGQGRGNRIGELPETKTATDPSMAPGDVTKGKILATIMQRTAPGEGEQASVDYSSQALVQIQQQSEEALTKEEIPAGAKEFVRQYFGSLEPEGDRTESKPAAAAAGTNAGPE